MPEERGTPQSGSYRLLQPTPEALEFQSVSRRIFVAPSQEEIVNLLSEAATKYTGARAASVFLHDQDTGTFSGDIPSMMPEKAVIDFIFADSKPLIIPHRENTFVAVFPLMVEHRRIGLLVLDVTDMAEEIAKKDLEPVSILADQAAAALQTRRMLSHSMGESALLANILDSITNAILTLDCEGRITRLNRNAMAMFSLTAEAVGKPYAEVLSPAVSAAVGEMIRQMGEMGFAMEKMVAAKLDQGLEINIAISTSMLRDENMVNRGTIVVCRDMTASRELERLRRFDRMKSEFVANVSHELKTPLTSIKAYTEALLDMARDEQVRSFLEVIDEESDRLLSLINDLLNVSRIQSGRLKMQLAPVPPRAVVDEILGISRLQSDKHQIVPEISDDMPPMLMDKGKMKEVVVNLVSNAIKYSPRGGKVWVRMRRDGQNLRIEVQDQGIGIPREDQDKLFQAFSRGESSHAAGIPGTGLGLVIAKAIVELHDGKIWFESEQGRGTTFFVLVPWRTEIKRGEIGSDLGSLAD